jgi:hypothetical protein
MSTTPSTFISGLYTNVLRRSVAAGTATNAELLSWDALVTANLLTQAQVTSAIVNSVEATNFVAPIVRIYQTFFNRVPDTAGLTFWVGQFRNGTSLATISSSFATAAEFTTAYGTPSASTIDSFLSALYTNVLGRTADAGGFAFWKAQFAAQGSNAAAAAAIANSFSASGEFVSASATNITNLLTVAASSGSLGTGPLGGASAGVVGTTFNMTSGFDTITGTANNDTINATHSATASLVSFNASDVISAGAGTDTLSITALDYANNDAVAVPSVTGVEAISVRAIDATAADLLKFTASNFPGLTSFTSALSTSAVEVTALASGATAGMTGNSLVLNGNLSAGWAASVTSATLNIASGTTQGDVTLTGGGVTAVTLNSTGASNTIGALAVPATATSLTINAATNLTTGTITGGALTTVTVAGAAASVTLGTLAATTTTVNASGLTAGGVSVTGVAATTAITGGAGNDSITFAAVTTKVDAGTGNDTVTTGAILTTGSVDGGAGNDTLVLGAVNQGNTASLAAKFTNFETLRTPGSIDMSLYSSLTAVEVTGNGSVTNMSATQAAAVQVRADIGAQTFALSNATGTSDVLSLTLGTGTTTAAATNLTGALTVTGFETLNIRANAGPTANSAANLLSTVASLSGATLNKVNMTGSAVAITDAATTVATVFDASALTGDSNATINTAAASIKGLTLGGNLISGSSVIGSAFVDTITTGNVTAAGSTYSLGAGADTISTTFARLRTNSVYNNIDGGAGNDTVTISDGAAVALTMVDADFKGLTNIERMIVTSTTTAAQSITTGGFFDTNFKASGFTLTTTATTGNITLDASNFSGASTVTATTSTGTITISGSAGNNTITTTSVGTAAAEGRTTITTLGGNDTVTVNLANATTTNVIGLGAGNDTFTHASGTGSMQITGGTGADTFTGLAGSIETYKYANSGDTGAPSSTNFDAITTWTTAEDILDFASAVTYAQNATTASAGVAAIGAGANSNATFNAADNTLALQIVAIEAALTKSTAAASAGTAPRALDATSWVNSGDTYVFVTDGTAGVTAGDTLIRLVGVTNTGTFTITGGDIVAVS